MKNLFDIEAVGAALTVTLLVVEVAMYCVAIAMCVLGFAAGRPDYLVATLCSYVLARVIGSQVTKWTRGKDG